MHEIDFARSPFKFKNLKAYKKLKQLQKLGFKIKILLADYHAFLNGKGTVKEIAETFEVSTSSLNKYYNELLAYYEEKVL